MTKFAMVGIFLFIPLTLVMCNTSIKVGHFLSGEGSFRARVLGLRSDEILDNKFSKTKSISNFGKTEKKADPGKTFLVYVMCICKINSTGICFIEVLQYSQVLKFGDYENLRFNNDEEDINFVPEYSLYSIRKKNHRNRYRKKHGNQKYRKYMKKQNNVGAYLIG